jgi:purine-nucleoside phosphorylase
MPANSFTALVQATLHVPPAIGLILGSGMSNVAAGLEPAASVSFQDVPGLGSASVSGHRGQLTLGRWHGKEVLVFEGRLHYYEGHPWESVLRPVRLAYELGARQLLLTNAAGGIHPALAAGSFLALRDHIEWTRPYCWRLPGPGGFGPMRPSPYSPRLRHLLVQAGREIGIDIDEGVYAAVTGPCYETPAEIRALSSWGADAVGMSTAREVQTAFDLGMECAALSCITNQAAGLSGQPLSHAEVLATAHAQSERLARLLEEFIHLL